MQVFKHRIFTLKFVKILQLLSHEHICSYSAGVLSGTQKQQFLFLKHFFSESKLYEELQPLSGLLH